MPRTKLSGKPAPKRAPKETGRPKSPISGVEVPPPPAPGEIRNPNGYNGYTPDAEMRKLKKLTEKELKAIAEMVVMGDYNELLAFVEKNSPKAKNATVLQVMLASVVSRIVSKGDMGAFDTLMNRLVGKVKERTTIDGNLNVSGTAQVIITMPSNGREAQNAGKKGA